MLVLRFDALAHVAMRGGTEDLGNFLLDLIFLAAVTPFDDVANACAVFTTYHGDDLCKQRTAHAHFAVGCAVLFRGFNQAVVEFPIHLSAAADLPMSD